MPRSAKPRAGSLQFWPRKRIRKVLPSVNWHEVQNSNPAGKDSRLLGFIAYKVGMASALVKDNTENSLTKGKRVILPVTLLETPNMKIYSVRFYNKGIVTKEIVVSNDKELKRKLKAPAQPGKLDAPPEHYEDIRVIVYSIVKLTSVKKTPDYIEPAFDI